MPCYHHKLAHAAVTVKTIAIMRFADDRTQMTGSWTDIVGKHPEQDTHAGTFSAVLREYKQCCLHQGSTSVWTPQVLSDQEIGMHTIRQITLPLNYTHRKLITHPLAFLARPFSGGFLFKLGSLLICKIPLPWARFIARSNGIYVGSPQCLFLSCSYRNTWY